jgi:hypothetical protein
MTRVQQCGCREGICLGSGEEAGPQSRPSGGCQNGKFAAHVNLNEHESVVSVAVDGCRAVSVSISFCMGKSRSSLASYGIYDPEFLQCLIWPLSYIVWAVARV